MSAAYEAANDGDEAAEMLKASKENEDGLAREFDALPEIVRAAKMKQGLALETAKGAARAALKARGLAYNKDAIDAEIKRVRALIKKTEDAKALEASAEAGSAGVDHYHFSYKPIGTRDGSYYFLMGETQEIVKLSSAALTKMSGLLQLAGLGYWINPDTNEVNIVMHADSLMRQCEACGLFDPSMVRGRGIWIDEGRVVAHLGDRLIVDGVESPLTIKSKYMYVRRPALDVDLDSPMPTEDGKAFLALVEMGAWVGGSLDARYMSGQVVCAAICGALGLRPHSWLTGRSMSGKSTMIAILKAALGNMLLHVVKGTTAAGIRQTQKGDSIAVLYDEADTEDEGLRRIVQGVIDLARIASGEDGGVVAKGTTHGEAIAWAVRSCFILASVNATLIQESDKTRFEVSELDMQKHAKKTSAEFEAARVELLTDSFGARFCARAIKLAPTIRANAKMFSAALVPILTKQRSSDLNGALLAGAYSLESEEVLTLERARELVEQYGITNEKPQEAERDETACWEYITQCRIPVMNTDDRQEMIQIGTLIGIASDRPMSADDYEPGLSASDGFDETAGPIKVEKAEALIKLRAAGFKVDRDGDGKLVVYVSIKSNDIANLLKPKPQWADYKNVLKRLSGAKRSPDRISFGSRSNKQYAIIIPCDE